MYFIYILLHSILHIYIYYIYIFIFVCILPYKLLQGIEYTFLCYTVDPRWLSVLYVTCSNFQGTLSMGKGLLFYGNDSVSK